MASPFRVFRRHQKKLLATLGIMAIVAFCVPMGFVDYVRSPSAASTLVVKTSEYGDISQSELQRLRMQRQQVLNFLFRVQQAVVLAKREANRNAKTEDQVAETAAAAQQVERAIGPASEEAVVHTWLCARHAERLGLVVSNEAINGFIRELTEGYLGPDRVIRIIADVNSNQQRFFDLLRHELLALRIGVMFNVSLAGTTPAQRWDYYTRLKRLATIEVIPVPVANYVGQVKDPDEQTLRDFFEKYKDNYPNPTSPEPGFHKPHEIAVRFFKADLEKFTAPNVVSEDEVKKFYQENKELFDRLAPAATKKPAAGEAGQQKPGEKPSEKPAGEANGKVEKKEPTEKPTTGEDTKPREKTPAEKPTAEKKGETDIQKEPAGEPSADGQTGTEEGPKPAEKPPTEGKKEDGKGAASPDGKSSEGPAADPKNIGDTSSAGVTWPFRLTSMLQNGSAESDTGPTETPAAKPSEAPPQPEPLPAEPAGPVPGPKPPAEDKKPVDETPPPAETRPADKPGEAAKEPAQQPQTPGEAAPKGPAGQREKPEDPLAGPVGEMIRRELAGQKIQEVFGHVQARMNRYRNEWVRYEVDVERDPDAQKPVEPDFEALAKENDPTRDQGLTTGQTPLMSQWDLQDEKSGIGRSFVDPRTSGIPFADYAFREKWDLYVAAESSDFGEDYRERSRYLFWKVEDSKEKVLEFEAPGVRQKVLQAWKAVEARKLAIKAAENFGDEARKRDQSLANTFIERPDVAVIATRPFSWMTYGNVPLGTARTPPRLSTVMGVDMAGPDFMRAVFELKQGQIGVAMNNPKTIAYVVRVTEINPSEKVLWAQFEVDNYTTYLEVAGAERGRTIQAWQKELQHTAGLEWVRPPQAAQSE